MAKYSRAFFQSHRDNPQQIFQPYQSRPNTVSNMHSTAEALWIQLRRLRIHVRLHFGKTTSDAHHGNNQWSTVWACNSQSNQRMRTGVCGECRAHHFRRCTLQSPAIFRPLQCQQLIKSLNTVKKVPGNGLMGCWLVGASPTRLATISEHYSIIRRFWKLTQSKCTIYLISLKKKH